MSTKAQTPKTPSTQTAVTTTPQQQQVNNKQKSSQETQPQSRNNNPRREKQQNGETQHNGEKQQNGGRRYDNDNRDSRNNGRRNNSNGNNGDRRAPRRTQDYSESRTLYISRVNVHELEGHSLSEHYKQQRVGYLVSLFEPFGKIESFETHLDTDKNYILISFADHESALKAYDHLRDLEKKQNAVNSLIAKLKEKGLPSSLAPNHRFSVQWSNFNSNPKAATKKQATQQTGPKNVIANAQAQTTAKQEKPEAQANTQTQTQSQTQAQPQQNGQAKKAEKKKQPQQQQQPQAQAQPTVGSEDLIREAEKAKLKDELAYYTEHAHHLVHELEAEKERCASRDINIAKLKAEHARVQAETERIQKKLTHETDWKKAAEQRVIALTEELTHFQQEHQRVNQLLEAFAKN